MKKEKINWAAVDWSKDDVHLAMVLDTTKVTVKKYRAIHSTPLPKKPKNVPMYSSKKPFLNG